MNTNDVNCSECCQKRIIKVIFNFISVVFIPVLLAVFTVILTLQQESIAKINRNVDLRIATERHQQNLALAIDEQRNAQLVAYMREVSDLLLANNFSLSKQILKSIVQPKTLAALRQLDETRKSYLLRFLHESQLLSTLNPPFLRLVGANLSHIHIGTVGESTNMRYTSLNGASLENALFTSVSFGYSDFSYARLHGASFHSISFDHASLYCAQLQNTSFDACSIYNADFSSANMIGATIPENQINSVGSISGAILPNGTKGRNPNLFIDSICQKMDNENGIQQNVNVSQYREWMKAIGRIRKLEYLVTGRFDKPDDLRANLTEFNQTGGVLQKYCFGNRDYPTHTTETELCIAYEWTFLETSLSNYANQYKNATSRINSHNETYMIIVDINLGQYVTCQDVYFSIETA